MKKIVYTLVVLGAWQMAHAQQDSAKGNNLNPVIVTANKFEQKQQETGKVLTVITQEELERSSGRSLAELLNEQAGIDIIGANNNYGTNQSVSIEGASSANTLILIDGVPAYDPSGISSEFDLNFINLNQVERVEILKGAQSTLYGSDAVAGVINIIMKKSGSKPIGGYASASAGTYNTGNIAAGINGNIKGWRYDIGGTYIHSEGFSTAYDSTGKAGFRNKPYTGQSLNASIGYDAGHGFSFRAYTLASQYMAAIAAGAFTDAWDYNINNKDLQVGAQANYAFGKSKLIFNYQYNMVDRTYIQDSTLQDPSDYQNGMYKGFSHFAELYGNFYLSSHAELVAGVDFRDNYTKQSYLDISSYGPYSTALGDSAKTTQEGIYASAILHDIAHFTFEFGGRVNNHSIYGWNETYSITPSYMIGQHLKLYANVSSAYRVPSLYQLYSEYGNKDLKPEQSYNYNAGIQYSSGIFTARVTAFARNINDVIYFYTNPETYASQYINQDKQRDNGVEAEVKATICPWLNASANYTYTDGVVKTTSDFTGKDTSFFNHYEVPRNLFNLQVNIIPCNSLTFGLHLRTVSSHEEAEYLAYPITLKGYYTLDAIAEYAATKQLTLFGDFYNITNQQYFDIMGYNSKRFNCMAGLRVRF